MLIKLDRHVINHTTKYKKFPVFFCALLLGAVYCSPFPNSQEVIVANTASRKKTFVGYFQSWSEKAVNRPEQLQIANIAPYVNVVIVSFMKPDASYTFHGYNLRFFSSDSMVTRGTCNRVGIYGGGYLIVGAIADCKHSY